MSTEAIMRVFFCVNENLYHSKRELFMAGAVKSLWQGCIVDTSHLHQHNILGSHFDALYECHVMVVLPLGLDLSENQKWELKVFKAFKRPVYLITPENNILQAQYVG